MRTFAQAWLLAALWMAGAANAQDTRFAYVGVLQDGADGAPTGSYDVRVRLFDGPDGTAAQLGTDALREAVAVEAGIFTLELDFGNAVLAPEAWLELAVRPAGSGEFEVLAPRQRLHGVPTALYAESTDWSGVANRPAGFADGTDDDALGTLGCADGEIPVHSPTGWTCGAPPLAEDGLSVLNGAGTPAPMLGREGEFYIDTSVHAIHGPKTAAGWGPPTSLVGPPGPPGTGGDGELAAMGSAQFVSVALSDTFPLYGFSLSMSRSVQQGTGGTINVGPPNLDSVVLLLDPDDFGLELYDYAIFGGFGSVRVSVAPANGILLELTDTVVQSFALQPSGAADGGALVVLTLQADVLQLQWNQDLFNWSFSGPQAGTGDGANDACNGLFSSFGHGAALPGEFTGIPLRTAPELVQFSRPVSGGTPGQPDFAPLLLDFELEPFDNSASGEAARPTCAANLLVHGGDGQLATSIHVFDATNPQWLWRVRWDAALAQYMAIVGDADGVQIQLGLLPFGDICHELGTGQEYCSATSAPATAAQ